MKFIVGIVTSYILFCLFSLIKTQNTQNSQNAQNVDMPINIFSVENQEYFKLLNNSIMDQIDKHPYHFKFSLIDCLSSNLKISEGKTVEGKDMIYYQVSSTCLVEEIQRELPFSCLNPQLFTYYMDKIVINNMTTSLNYFNKRNDYSLIDFDSSTKFPYLSKEDILSNATSFLCHGVANCSKIELVKTADYHCGYKSIPNISLNENVTINETIVTCLFNKTNENKIYELGQVRRVDNITGLILSQNIYIRGKESFERFDKISNNEDYLPNDQVNLISRSYSKYINDTYFPAQPSPVDPSPSPVTPSPSPVDPQPTENSGSSGVVIFLIILVSLSLAVGAAYLIWKHKFKKVNDSPLLV